MLKKAELMSQRSRLPNLRRTNRMNELITKLKKLKQASGSHSPALGEITSALGYNPVKYDFCFLSNPYATQLIKDHLLLYINQELNSLIESYPASTKYVSRLLASFEGLDSDRMLVSNGAVQAIDWAARCWNLKNLLIPLPTFSTYYELLPERHTFHLYEPSGKDISPSSLIKAACAYSCDSILLICPSNPTGYAPSIVELDELIDSLHGIKLIIDDSFCHFLNDYPSYKQWRAQIDNPDVIFIKSFSKDCGIAGVRLGYLYTFDNDLYNKAITNTTWNLNNFAIACAEYISSSSFQEEYEKVRLRYIADRDLFYEVLSQLSCYEVFRSQSNHFLLKYDSIKKPDLVWELLVEKGLYLRTMSDKVGLDNSYIRIASRTQSENLYAAECLSEVAFDR